ncbi:MAG: DUF1127 domain-containing protein [Acetobacteraceae bacterium]
MSINGVSGMISLFEMPPRGQVEIGTGGAGGRARRSAGGPGLFARAASALRGFAGRLALARREAVLLRDLARLSDRDLADIGISRGELPRIFKGR